MSKQANENEENPSTEGNSESTESVEAGPPAVASAPEAGAEAGTGAGESAPAESDSSASPESPAEGWYPDPNAGGANVMRYWNGSAWTEKIKEGQTELNTTIRPPVERKAILAQQLQGAAARGSRIESQSEFQAVLVQGQPVNHTLHAILTIFTCLLWGIVWAVIAATGGEKREMIVVDEFGNVQHQKLGKA